MSDEPIFQKEKSGHSNSESYSSTKEKEIVSDFISSLFEEEKEEQEKIIVINFVESLFDEEKPKIKIKKVNNKTVKNRVVKAYLPKNNKMKNNDKNKIKKNNINIKKENQDRTLDTDLYRNSLIKKILNINKHKNYYERNKSIELRPKYININDEDNLTKSNNNKTYSTKKKIMNTLLDYNNKSSEKKRPTIELFTDIESEQKFKAKLESEKERKECEEKIRILKNHISAMKRQQENMNKKILFFKNKENMLNNAKKFKEKSKRDLYEYKIIKRAELEQKKKNIEKIREKIDKGIKESKYKTKLEKTYKYKHYQQELKELNKQNESNNTKKIIEQIQKIKAIRDNNKNISINRRKFLNKNYNDINEKKYETNIEKMKLLKEEIKQLLNEEDECLTNLNKTKNQYDNMTSYDKYLSTGHKINKNEYKPVTEAFNLDKE
jgi:hypothetical protein